MALFGKKPQVAAAARPAKPPKPGKPPKAVKQPKPGKPPKPPKAVKPGKPPKPPKPSKGTVNPADFIALRFEMIDLRARLEASEQSKAMVETRLAALDAGNEMARRPHEGGEVRHRIDDVEAQLSVVAAAAAAASAAAESATAKATAAAAAAVPTAAPPPVLDESLSARVDELMSRVEAAPDANRLAELEARIDAAAKASRLGEIEASIEDLSAKLAQTAPQPLPTREATIGADLATVARLDQISARVDTFDALTIQLAQLNARVTAQAEFGAQLSSLRDRIAELSNGSTNPASRLPAVADDDLRDNVQALTYRVEVLAERVESGDVRTRQTAEQLSNIEHRMSAVSTELTNQVSELGRDIDGFAGFRSSTGDDESHSGNGNGHVSAELLTELQSAQIKLAEEQARYEIAFRQDLATLAEHVRRAKSG